MNRILSALIVCALLAVPSFVEAAAIPLPIWLGQFDALSQPLSGGKVYTYAAGTTTPKATWTNAAKTATSTNPIVLGSNGRAVAYGDGLYKIVVKDSAGVVVTTVDNVELVSAVNPTSLNTTGLTAASATFDAATLRAGWIASAVIDASLLTSPRLSGAKILAQPVAASDPVDLGYFNASVAAGLNAAAASLASHAATDANPHGATLTQTNLVASDVLTDILGPSTLTDLANGGYLRPTYYGLDIFGYPTSDETGLFFRGRTGATETAADLFVAASDLSGAKNLKCGSEVESHQITYSTASNTVDFGGAALTNFNMTIASAARFDPLPNFVVEWATSTGILVPQLGAGAITLASYTLSSIASASYVVNWGGQIHHGAYASNPATIAFKFYVNGGLVQTRYCSVSDDLNSLSQPEWTYQGNLKDGDTLAITLSTYQSLTVGANGVYADAYYIQGHAR